MKQPGAGGTDAHLAAWAIERGLILQTTDPDFARFLGLKWKNPLLGKKHRNGKVKS
jgi:predicted nucleic acid-binding protein